MEFEVEQKFRVTDLAAIAARLNAQDAVVGETIVQVDRYFAHPARDFASTDEALRLRQVGDRNFITYKGPKLDRVTKTRREIELPLGTGGSAEAAQWSALLESLSFRPVAEVRKSRRLLYLDWHGARLEIALDAVDGVGTFVEIELCVDTADLAAAQARVCSFAAELGLADAERRSYLELLLETRTTQPRTTQPED